MSPRASTRCASAGRSGATCSRASKPCSSRPSRRRAAGRSSTSAPARVAPRSVWRRRARAAIGVDASGEMLRVAGRRAADAGVPLPLAVTDAHALPFGDRSFDAAVSLRVLMHAIDWRQCVAELCRVARWRVVIDFPSRTSFAALESAGRRLGNRLGGSFEAYRVMAERDVVDALRATAFASSWCGASSCCRLPCTRRWGRRGLTETVERGLASIGLSRLLARPSRWWASDDGARHRRVRVHRRISGAVSRPAGDRVRALVRRRDRAGGPRRGRHRDRRRRSHRSREPRRAWTAPRSSTTSPRSIATPGCRRPYRAVNATAVGTIVELAQRAGARRVVQCSTVGVHGDVETRPPTKTRRSRPATSIRRPSSKASARPGNRGARRHGARDRASDRHLRPGRSPAVQDLRQDRAGRFVMLGRGHALLHVTVHRRSLRGFPVVRDRAGRRRGGRTSSAGGRCRRCGARVQTAEIAGVRPPRLRLPVWPVWLAGAACEAVLCRSACAAHLPPPCRLLPQEPRVRHRPGADSGALCAPRPWIRGMSQSAGSATASRSRTNRGVFRVCPPLIAALRPRPRRTCANFAARSTLTRRPPPSGPSSPTPVLLLVESVHPSPRRRTARRSQTRTRIQPPGGRAMTFKPTVLAVEPERELRWLGAHRPRHFRWRAHPPHRAPRPGSSRFTQAERFSGILVAPSGARSTRSNSASRR